MLILLTPIEEVEAEAEGEEEGVIGDEAKAEAEAEIQGAVKEEREEEHMIDRTTSIELRKTIQKTKLDQTSVPFAGKRAITRQTAGTIRDCKLNTFLEKKIRRRRPISRKRKPILQQLELCLFLKLKILKSAPTPKLLLQCQH